MADQPNTSESPVVRRLNGGERKEWLQCVVQSVSGNPLTIGVVLLLEDLNADEAGKIDLSTIDCLAYGLPYRAMIAGCKRLSSFELLDLVKIRPGYWLARLRLPDWPQDQWSLLQ